MTDDLDTRVREAARRFALENAVKHGAANPGAVVGRVMGSVAGARERSKDVPPLVAAVVAEVNAMSAQERAAAFAEVAGEMAAAKPKVEAKGPLKPLVNAEKGKVVLRLAPNPSGPPHFGHGRGMVINWVYREMYDGKFILRFDDTDTTVKPPWMPAYDMFPETFEWLCGKPDRIIRASSHMERYYAVAEEAFRARGLYVCECVGDDFRKLKEQATACPHRDQSVETNLAKWERMKNGSFVRGQAVVRVKTDMAHKDPALRDWVAIRIAEEPHPLVGDKYRAWPLLDFQSAVDDHDEGVTHIIRGKDLRDSTAKQEFLYQHLGWKYPETAYWGRVSVHEFGKFSKSILQEAIRQGEYEGWDDPRLPTFPALRRRGIQPEAIRNFWISFGITEKDIAASVVTLEAENRKIVEPTSNRYSFVADPVEVRIAGAPPELVSRAALHPDRPERGERLVRLKAQEGAAGIRVLVAREDFDSFAPGDKVRLKDLANGTLGADATLAFNESLAVERGVRVVQWTSADAPRATLIVPILSEESSEVRRLEGRVERALFDEPVGAVVQLERVGFARIDAKTADHVTLVFAHK